MPYGLHYHWALQVHAEWCPVPLKAQAQVNYSWHRPDSVTVFLVQKSPNSSAQICFEKQPDDLGRWKEKYHTGFLNVFQAAGMVASKNILTAKKPTVTQSHLPRPHLVPHTNLTPC